jgi:hypothetical protein
MEKLFVDYILTFLEALQQPHYVKYFTLPVFELDPGIVAYPQQGFYLSIG